MKKFIFEYYTKKLHFNSKDPEILNVNFMLYP